MQVDQSSRFFSPGYLVRESNHPCRGGGKWPNVTVSVTATHGLDIHHTRVAVICLLTNPPDPFVAAGQAHKLEYLMRSDTQAKKLGPARRPGIVPTGGRLQVPWS